MNLHLVDITVLAGLTFWLLSLLKKKRHSLRSKGLPFPPGPKGLPVVGNVFDMPKSKEWLTVAEWGKKYGDVVYVESLGRPMVFLNTYKAAVDLLDNRSAIYSDRPHLPMVIDIMGWYWMLSLVPYGDRFRKYRRFLHKFFRPSAVTDYHDLQARETHRLIANLLDTPRNYVHHIRRTAGAIIMMISYGHEVAPEGDLFITLADDTIESASQAGAPGTYIVDFLPWLRYIPPWFPGAEFIRKGREWYKLSQSMLMTPYTMTKEKILNGIAKPSMMSKLMEINADKDGRVEAEDIIAGCIASSYVGGADTSVSVLTSFVLAMVLDPNVQRRGQEEIDRVVGHGRLPTFADKPSLPYVEGIARESLRWNPVIPLGIPHRVMVDDVYDGHFIPAGSIVIPNQWALLRDESEYPDSSSFLPERWLPMEGKAVPRPPNTACFGFGRRKCPGLYLAENSIFIAIATILATLNIGRAKDANGEPIIPTGEYAAGIACHPEPFECSLTPRSPDAVALVRHAVESSG